MTKLELVCETLMEMLVFKKISTRDEITVLMSQIDLLDGVEDGAMSAEAHKNAPTCKACHRFINPRRDQCVYCEEPIDHSELRPRERQPVPMVTCGGCNESVPQNATYFSDQGLRCSDCFHG